MLPFRWRLTTFPLLLPFYAALRLTIPLVDPASYSQQWLVASLLCSPLLAIIYIDVVTPWSLFVAMVIGAGWSLDLRPGINHWQLHVSFISPSPL